MDILPKIIAVGMQKGGVGKTTFAANLSGVFTAIFQKQRKEKKILLIDFDPQASATSFFFSESSIPSNETVASIFDTENPRRIIRERQNIIRHSRFFSLDVVPSHINLSAAEAASLVEDGRRLQYWIEGSAKVYDYIIIDCPPSLGRLCTNALMAATDVVIPCTPDIQSYDAIKLYVQTIQYMKDINPSLNFLGIVINIITERESVHRAYRQALQETFGPAILGEIHRGAHFQKIANNRELLIDGDKDRREYKEYREIAQEILNRMEPNDGREAN
jgi:chromosome partitioning protein